MSNEQKKKNSSIVSQLEAAGAYSTRKPTPIKVEWKNYEDGSEHLFNFHIVNRNTEQEEQYSKKIQQAKEAKNKSIIAEIIANSIVLEDGSPAIDYNQAAKLKPSLSEAICVAIADYYTAKKK